MRRVSCDQHEFDSADSEQLLELAIAAPGPHCPDLVALLAACGASARRGPAPPVNWVRWAEVGAHLEQFAGLAMPHPSQVRAAILLQDDWNNVEVGVAFESVLVWYHWFTSV